MARPKKRPASTIKRSRRRLINRLFRLSQLDLFVEMDEAAQRVVEKLKADIALATGELEALERA
jgi:hypothetical protein